MRRNHVVLFPFALFIAITVALFAIAGCGGKTKTDPIPVGEMVEFRDAALGFHLKYPKDWSKDAADGVRARFFSAADVDKRVLDPTGPFPDGAALFLDLVRTDAPDSAWRAQIAEMSKMGFQVEKEFPVTVAGKQAIRVNYTGAYTVQIRETGHHVYLLADSLLYDFRFAGFSDLYEANKGRFDAILASFVLPKPVEKGRDETLPSTTMDSRETPFFSFQYPDNFNFTSPPKGNNDLVLELRGKHLSSSIRFDVFGAKALTVEKVFQQNKARFPASAVQGRATIGGLPAMTLTYNASPTVERRIAYVVKNDKVIRLTLDWVKAQRTEYLAAYDQVVASIKIK